MNINKKNRGFRYCEVCKNKLRKNGFSKAGKLRWRCLKCKKSLTINQKDIKKHDLFYMWIQGGYNIRQLTEITNLSKATIHRMLLDCLEKEPPINIEALKKAKYIAFDGKFLFKRKASLVIIYDCETQKPILSKLIKSESKKYILPWLKQLKELGLNPIAVTTDGLEGSINSFRQVFGDIETQRCLFHIKLQVNMWVRRPARTDLGKDLSKLANWVTNIQSSEQTKKFYETFDSILEKYKEEVEILKERKTKNNLARDMFKAITLIENGKEYFFKYLQNDGISKTTSGLEGYNKQVQRIRAFQHSGLSRVHQLQFYKWKILMGYYKKDEFIKKYGVCFCNNLACSAIKTEDDLWENIKKIPPTIQ